VAPGWWIGIVWTLANSSAFVWGIVWFYWNINVRVTWNVNDWILFGISMSGFAWWVNGWILPGVSMSEVTWWVIVLDITWNGYCLQSQYDAWMAWSFLLHVWIIRRPEAWSLTIVFLSIENIKTLYLSTTPDVRVDINFTYWHCYWRHKPEVNNSLGTSKERDWSMGALCCKLWTNYVLFSSILKWIIINITLYEFWLASRSLNSQNWRRGWDFARHSVALFVDIISWRL